ncbi:flagellar biosynthesis protein [Noviherbaspirillum humi]|uniref:Flagellar biosynthesis protein n=1 Tax=Noviherbaspirillum humi TaxID=1688639 RepID=A0A239FZD5_9BURK|nr:EscU/YscU/HrcU family type III secretion system export apparatus switch protein [Noviherbaspirillum humi]SNS61652.1 flagellar biosynthesis protein [Noviherbaspirillum humi]
METAKRQNAVALAYGAGDAAPRVVAKGNGLVAEQIIARAREHGVFVHQSRELVALLMQVDLDKNIPPALYRVVAELLAWLYHIDAAQRLPGPDAGQRGDAGLPASDHKP